MIISLIAAMDKNRLIGKGIGLPWPRFNADMKHFRSVTRGKPIVMGRKTWDSLPNGALKGRLNVVLTRSTEFTASDCMVFHSVEDILGMLGDNEEIIVIGGAEIYEVFLPHVQRMYLTHVEGEFTGDTHFPSFEDREWESASLATQVVDEKNPYACTFETLIRKPV